MNNSDIVKSPCVSVCKLDEHNICIGCWRTLDEIAVWSRIDNQQRAAVLEACERRKRLGKLA